MKKSHRSGPRGRLYYGWVVLGILTLTGVLQGAFFNPTMGAFIKPLTEEFDWSRSLITGASSAGTLAAGALALGVGPLLDRFGPRWIMSLGFLVVGAAAMGLAFVTQLWHFYLVTVIGRAAVLGVVNLASTVSVAKWFVRKRGQAIAVSNLGPHLGQGGIPLYAQVFISNFGWRTGAIAVSLLTWATTLVPCFLLLRRQPEDLGLRPDGDQPEQVQASAQPMKQPALANPADETSFTLRQALRTRVFYVLLSATAAFAFVVPGVHLHLLAYLNDQGLGPGTAVLVLTVWSMVSLLGVLVGGLLSDRVPVRYIMGVGYFGLAVNLFLLIQVQTAAIAFLFAVSYGLVFGMVSTAESLILPSYFGRASLGAIRGVTLTFHLAGSALGPLAAALVFDATSEYTLIFLAFLAVYGVAGVAMLLTPPPQRARAS